MKILDFKKPSDIQRFKENDILDPNGGELLGFVNNINFKRRKEENTIEMFISLFGFRRDGKILENTIWCILPIKNVTFYISFYNEKEKKFDDVFTGLLEWGGFRGFERFNGTAIKLKYEFDDKGLIVREITPLDNTCRLISSNNEANSSAVIHHDGGPIDIDTGEERKADNYETVTGQLFKYSHPFSVTVEPLKLEDIDTSGASYVDEFPPITKNEIKNIIGESLVGRFDKIKKLWYVAVTITGESNLANDAVIEKYFFDIYDYKTPELNDGDLFRYHVGGGWRMDIMDETEYKSPFEKCFAKSNECNESYFGNASRVFIMYLYNEILKARKQ